MDDINVRDYGALGDGKDYTSQIQAALNVGGRIYIPKGTYLISNPLVVKGNTNIIMESDTILKKTGSVTINTEAQTPQTYISGAYAIFTNGNENSNFTVYNGNGNITIEGGVIDCDGANNSTISNGICFGHGNNILLKNITIKNVYDGHHIEMNSCTLGMIENCRFLSHSHVIVENGECKSEAVHLNRADNIKEFPLFGGWDETKCTNIIIKDCYFYDCGDGIGSNTETGLSANYHQSTRILHNYFENIKYDAIKIKMWIRAVISDNIINSTQNGYGIMAKLLYNSALSDNIIQNTKKCGLGYQNSYNIVNTGGEISGCTGNGIIVANGEGKTNNIKFCNMDIFNNATLGMNLESDRIILNNCSIRNSAGHGIYIHSSNNSEISGCYVTDNGGHGITATDDAVQNFIHGNIFVNNQNVDILIGLNASENRVAENTVISNKTSGKNIWIQSTTKNNVVVFNDVTSSSLTDKIKNDSTTSTVRDNIL